MAVLHYADKDFDIADDAAAEIIRIIGAHATRGGWIEVTDTSNVKWSILVTPGVPIYIDAHQQHDEQNVPRRSR